MQALSEFSQYTCGKALNVTNDVTGCEDFQHTFEVNNLDNNNKIIKIN